MLIKTRMIRFKKLKQLVQLLQNKQTKLFQNKRYLDL